MNSPRDAAPVKVAAAKGRPMLSSRVQLRGASSTAR